ncbi:MAG: hypothetical protein Q8Q33_00580 [Chlamydiota bacterium]|nr:hypothetical protein [Chlamydiota bacterium]
MYQVEFNIEENLINVVISGHFNFDEATRLHAQVAQNIEKLSPGFGVLHDISGIDNMDGQSLEPYKQMMDLCNVNGVAKIARIIKDEHADFGLGIMSVFHYGADVHIRTFYELDEAMAFLKKAE